MLNPDLQLILVDSHANTLENGSEKRARSMLTHRRPVQWRESGAPQSGGAGSRRFTAEVAYA